MIPSRRDDRERCHRALARARDDLRGLARERTGGALEPEPARADREPRPAPPRPPLPLRRRPL